MIFSQEMHHETLYYETLQHRTLQYEKLLHNVSSFPPFKTSTLFSFAHIPTSKFTFNLTFTFRVACHSLSACLYHIS